MDFLSLFTRAWYLVDMNKILIGSKETFKMSNTKEVELTDQQIRDIAESRGWRMIPDDEYAFGGYAVQNRRNFLEYIWWSDEYLCKNKEAAIETLKKLIL